MIYTESTSAHNADYSHLEERETRPAYVESASLPKNDRLHSYAFQQRVFALEPEKVRLILKNYPILKLDPRTMDFEVDGWGIKMSVAKAIDLPREICRKFLLLFGKAERDELSATEASSWLQIVDQVDYQLFWIDRAAPQYLEGKLIRNNPIWIVEWQNGNRMTINAAAVGALHVLDVGDRFSAFVKLGKDSEVLSLERLSILPNAEPLTSENTWPLVRS